MTDELEECWKAVRAPPPERVYSGTRDVSLGKCKVYVRVGDRKPTPLKLCKGILNHSPSGFEWGYSGSGPAQLALAILVDALGAKTRDEKDRAIQLHQAFKSAVIVSLPSGSWTMTHGKVLEVVAKLEASGRKTG